MKKLLATILALVMALSLCTIGWADVTTVKDETELKNAVANGAGKIYFFDRDNGSQRRKECCH